MWDTSVQQLQRPRIVHLYVCNVENVENFVPTTFEFTKFSLKICYNL